MKEGGEGNGYFCENQNKIRIGDPYYKMILTYETNIRKFISRI
jgi:hypothetical protein